MEILGLILGVVCKLVLVCGICVLYMGWNCLLLLCELVLL